MIKNYFKIAWRNLKSNRSYAAINIIGLSLGIACGLLIFTLVSYHLSFDNFHSDRDNIYRVVTEFHEDNVDYTPGTPQPLGKFFAADYSYTDKIARVKTIRQALISIDNESNKGIKKFSEEGNIALAEPDFFEIFNFPLLKGNKKSVLAEPNTAIITQTMAKKYFGTDDAVGKVLQYENKTTYKITGVLKDIPPNTDRQEQIYLSYLNLKDIDSSLARNDSWGRISSSMQCFMKLKKGVSIATVNAALKQFAKKHLSKEDAKTQVFNLQPLTDIHFNGNYDGETDKKTLWAFSLVGVFLLVTACVNFINLATALALSRAKEVGIRKVMGSLPRQLFWQFITETTLLTLLAAIIAYCLALSGLPFINNLFGIKLSINIISNPSLVIFISIAVLSVIFLAGSYPSLVLSRFRPALALKGKLSQRSIGGFSLRRILVIVQFSISQILIIGTLVIAMQMNFSKSTDLGFIKKGIVLLPAPGGNQLKVKTLESKLSAVAGVESISVCQQAPASQSNHSTDIVFNNRDKAELWEINEKDADNNYVKTFGLHLVTGRNLFESDTAREFLVNEVVVSKLNLQKPQDAIGKVVNIGGQRGIIVGVLKNFHNASFRSEIAPIAITSNYRNYNFFAVKLNLSGLKNSLAVIEKNWNEIYPDQIYNAQFLDDRIARFYKQDNLMLNLIEAFAGVAILIGCLGLYGLISFMALRKTKEIGVRKVLGASIPNILWIFGKEFTVMLIVAFVISAPVALWAMHNYLQEFKFRIQLGPFIFLAAIAVSFIIAATTVAYRSFRAASVNPVKSLRSE